MVVRFVAFDLCRNVNVEVHITTNMVQSKIHTYKELLIRKTWKCCLTLVSDLRVVLCLFGSGGYKMLQIKCQC